jgi:hypothetical protein
MEIAVNLTKEYFENLKKFFDDNKIELNTDRSRELIKQYLQMNAAELIGVKAVDQVHRRLVIEKIKHSKPKKVVSKEDQEFDQLRREIHRARKSEEKRNKSRGKDKHFNAKPQPSKVRRSSKW